MIGSQDPAFLTGQTDLRGVFAAEGVNGQVTAVARAGTDRYAFYRGTTPVGRPLPAPAAVEARPLGRPMAEDAAKLAKPAKVDQLLNESIKNIDLQNQSRGIDRLQNRLNPGRKGINPNEAR